MRESQSRRRWRAGLATLSALAAVVATPAVVASASTTRTVGQSIVLYMSPDRSSVVLAPAPGVSKQTYNATRDLQALGVRLAPIGATNSPTMSSFSGRSRMGATVSSGAVRPMTLTSTSLYASASIPTCPPRGQCSSTGVSFNTSWNGSSGWVATINFGPGRSQGAWWGCCPFNADVMYLADTWSVSGLAVSVSVPLGVGFSGSGSSASWSGSANNQWLITHSFTGIQFTSWWALCCPSESASTTAQFGGAFFSVTANS